MVLNQMDKDATGKMGVPTMTARIAFDQEVQIPRDRVSEVMRTHNPAGFQLRDPTAKKIWRVPIVSIGIHERWTADGHDKLNKIGFPIWAAVDFATGKILDAWVVPNNRLGTVIAYLFLSLVEKFKGEHGFWFELTSFEYSRTRDSSSIYHRLRLRNHPSLRIRQCNEVQPPLIFFRFPYSA